MLHHLIETILPPLTGLIELIGICVLAFGTLRAFYCLVRNLAGGQAYPVKHILSEAMLTGLSFMMAGEILKTMLVRSMDQVFILGGIIVLRAMLTFMIFAEEKAEKHD